MKKHVMNRYFLLAMLLCSCDSLFSQKMNIDSLRNILKKPLTQLDELSTLNALGKALRKSDAHEASVYLFKTLSLSEKLKDSLRTANAYQLLGNIMVDQGQYEQATEFFVKAIVYFQKKQDTLGIIKVNQGLGQCFDLLKNYRNAIQYFNEALTMAIAFKKKSIIMACYMNLGVAYQESGDNDNALQNYEKCRSLLEELDLKEGRFALYNNMSVVLSKQHRQKEALEFGHRSYALLDPSWNPIDFSKVMLNLGELFYKMGQGDSAVYWTKKSLLIAEKNKFPEQIMNANKVLSGVYAQKRNYRDAYLRQQKFLQIKDSLFDQREMWLVQQLHEGYQLGKKEEEIISLKAKQDKLTLDLKINNLITLLMVVIAISFVIISLVVSYNYFRKRKLASALNDQNKEIQRLNQVLEIKALRSQMDPHFVFNALNGLQHFLTIHSAEDSVEYLSKVARLIRFTLQNASKDWVMLKEEMEILRLYLQVEQYRFPGKFDFSFEMEKGVENEKIPFLVIQPYVENAVLHGLIPQTSRNGILKIRARKEKDMLLVVIEDNGVGRSSTVQIADPLFTSMGSGLVKERLKKLTLQLGVLMDVHVEDLKDQKGNANGTRSTLIFETQANIKAFVAA